MRHLIRPSLLLLFFTLFPSLTWTDAAGIPGNPPASNPLLEKALHGETPMERVRAVGKITDQKTLYNLAMTAPWRDVRMEAIRRLEDENLLSRVSREGDWFLRQTAVKEMSDQKTLGEIALHDPDWMVREEAVMRLDDEDLLYSIATHDPDRRVCRVAARTLTDPDKLKRVILGNFPLETRREALTMITDDDELLVEIARKSADPIIKKLALALVKKPGRLAAIAGDRKDPLRMIAVALINDETTLSAIALDGDGPLPLRREAIERLRNSQGLAEVANGRDDPALRIAAILHLTDQDLLTRLAETEKNPAIRRAAVKRLTLQETLIRLLQTEKEDEVREEIVNRLNDETILERLAGNEKNETVRLGAVRRVQNPDLLEKIIAKDPSGPVREAALRKITRKSEAFFKRLARNDPYAPVRREAVSRLTDQPFLADVVANDTALIVRKAALRRLTNRDLIHHIARENPNWFIRREAVKKITDSAFLSGIALHDPDWDVRETALGLIRDTHPLAKALLACREMSSSRQALRYLHDPLLLTDLAFHAADPAIRLAATRAQCDRHALKKMTTRADTVLLDLVRQRLANLREIPKEEPLSQVEAVLDNPVLEKLLSNPTAEVEREWEERRYADYHGETYPPERGKVLVEEVTVTIRDSAGTLLSRRIFMGKKPNKSEHFDEHDCRPEAFRVKYNLMYLDLLALAGDLIAHLPPETLPGLAGSSNKYIATAVALQRITIK